MVERFASGKSIEYPTVRALVDSILTFIPEGLDLPYLNSNSKDKHVLVLLPDNSINQCWWIATHQLTDTVRKIKDDLKHEVNEITDEAYRFAIKSLKRGNCRLYLWRVHSIHVLKNFKENIRKIVKEKKERKQDPNGIAMETWVARLKAHPEFACMVSVNPKHPGDIARHIRSRACKAWRKILREYATGENKGKAHAAYAARNRILLDDPNEFDVFRVATFTTHYAFARFRTFPWNDWVLPSKAVGPVGVCKHYSSEGYVKDVEVL